MPKSNAAEHGTDHDVGEPDNETCHIRDDERVVLSNGSDQWRLHYRRLTKRKTMMLLNE